ncbi:MAG: hypothetical protein ACP5KE_06870 [Candidatus Methanodesulfokora sp.]
MLLDDVISVVIFLSAFSTGLYSITTEKPVRSIMAAGAALWLVSLAYWHLGSFSLALMQLSIAVGALVIIGLSSVQSFEEKIVRGDVAAVLAVTLVVLLTPWVLALRFYEDITTSINVNLSSYFPVFVLIHGLLILAGSIVAVLLVRGWRE